MKNKKATYILLVLVIAVWGAVALRIINHFRKPDDNLTYKNVDVNPRNNYLENDTLVSLKLDYPDPFLKYNRSANVSNQLNQRSSSNANIRQRISPANVVEEIINWPEIRFSGVILNNKTNEKLGLMEINSESLLMKKGEQKNGIQIIELYADSVRISLDKHFKTVLKTN